MLTRHSVIAESSHLEAVPINLVATEDGRTILAVTERKDGVLEIVAAPVTLIGQTGGTTASLVDVKNYNEDFILQSPVFQISLGNIHGSELEQSVQNSEGDPEMNGRTKVESNEEAKCLSLDLPELDRLPGSDSFADEKNSLCRKHSSVGTSVTKSSQGRPRKDAAISSQVVERLKCDICQQEFTKQTLYRRHMENHAEEKPHRCPKCSASFNIPTNFTLHMATHNTGEPKCPECGRKFARMASLKSHMLLHEKEENLFCTECEDAFLTKAQLDAHLKLHGEKWTSEETRKCKLCNKQFGQPALYRLHIREHYRLQTKIVKQTKRGAKHKTMYKCTICLKSFQKPSQLMRHIRVHTGEKPFKCTVCSRAFTQKSSLQIHTWQHNGIRPHACEFCNAKFSQKGNLNAHIMRVHNIPEGEPIYGCNYCSCIFKKLGSLNGHMKRVHVDTAEGNVITKEFESADAVESDIRATVDSVITQLASLESNSGEFTDSLSNCNSTVLSGVATKKDILQQALKNSGLPSKMKALCEGSSEMKRLEARTNFVTLLDRAPDGGTRKYLTIKQRCVGNVRWYACTFCHKEFKKPSDLIRHLRVHTQEKPFKCTHCYRSFALKSTLIAHERTHSGTKRYACGSCDKTFACQGSLVAHIRLHAKPGECSNKVDLNDEKNIGVPAVLVDTGAAHLPGDRPKTRAKSKLKLSPEAESLVPEVVLQEPLVISDTGNKICVAQVPSKEKRAYEAAADPARPHKCWVCHAAFRKISHLKQHHRRHTGERPYKCTKCDRRFTSNSVLKSHLHTHEDSRPYGCPVCNARFSTQSSTKRHLVTHSNKRPFMCPYCHKTFKTYVNCRKHMKIHKHELAQRQLEQRRIQAQEPIVNKSDSNVSDKRGTAPETPRYVSSSFSDTCTDLAAVTAAAAAAATTTILTASSSTFSDSMEGSRIDPVEISFQPQIAPDFSQAFSDQLQTVTDRKEKARPPLSATTDTPTTVNGETGSDMAITGLENAQLLHVDETGSVTLPVYSGDRALTPESIREIEETLNQQLFNIGMNLSLETSHHSDHSNRTALSDFDNTKEQPVLNVIYENSDTAAIATATATTSNNNHGNRSNNSIDSAESHGEHMFESQLDSFEMEHIALQSDNEIDIGLDSSNSANMASILARSANEEHRLSISVARAENTNSSGGERSCMQTVVLITGQHLPGKESTRSSQVEMEEASKEISRKQCAIDPMLITREFRGAAAQHLKSLSEGRTVSPESPDIGKSDPNKVSRGESLLQCHMCDLQGFTAVGLKEHLKIHRGTKEYQCTECSSTFCTNGGLNRHSKIHVNKQSWKCPMCEESFSSRLELRSHGRVHGTSIWNSRCSGMNDAPGNGPVSLQVDLPLNEALVDPDSTVSEKVLLDTVAERQVMERVENGERKERKEYTNKCKYCPKTFRKPSDLIRHVRTHTGERPYKCDYCSKSFAVKCTLDSHTKVHTGKKTFRCHVCSSLFATKGSLKVHMRLHTGSKPFKCPVCDSRFRTSGHRKVHLMKHAREHKNSPKRKQKHLKIAAIAEVAAADFITRAESERKMSNYEEQQQQQQQQQHSGYSHFETINVETAATCLTDQISFDAETVLPNSNPILSVNEGSQLVANLHFLLTNGLVTIQPEETILPQSITNSSHDERPTTIVSDASACIPTLGIASSSENGKDEMSVGERSKEQLSPTTYQFHSNGCVLTVASASAATQATQLEPFSKIALEKASSAVIRKTSIKGNSAKKECDVCGKTFTKPYQVERHKRIHTGERPYKCDLCSKSFAQKSTLQMHQKHHTGDRPYPCPHCEYSFTQKGNLRTHMKRVHQLDGIDAKKLKRTRQPAVLPKSLQSTPTLAKGLNLDDISSFVEFLK